ncbi:helicase HerA-like domain-containing protein [Cytophaga aurantiaca]|uniref:helicase HerA-like domain-containing protein n=1 Tax=Cytophaga aurantiaca TaxID=29530 RepID=UPI000368130C|nr:helicase HerA-like domain-containing protein [Cytophaga aurantiaca]
MSDNKKSFTEEIQTKYATKGDFILLGNAILNGESVENTPIKLPLKMLNRHGMIAGATGTGKTKTLQTIAESLSLKGVPTLLMDIKGDLSGIAAPGTSNDKIVERQAKIGAPYEPQAFPTELFSLSKEKGVRLRATVSEFGPVLFSKILGLNDTQSGIVSLIFKFCDDERLPLLDLEDFKRLIQYITNEGKVRVEKEYGKISSTSTSTILRKVIELEQQGADLFFGEYSFEVEDLLRKDASGKGYVSIMKVTDIQDRPKLFSTFMLSLLSEIYSTFPEVGDLEKPKLVIFIDESHLIFNEASEALLNQIETIIKLIRSKGVGIFFCTQNPMDIPASILGQLGLKVQHALRAFTAVDRKQIKLTAANYPLTEFYDTETLLTSMGIGEAAITVLTEKGTPAPLAHTLLCAPRSRMDILTDSEIDQIISSSSLTKKYNQEVDRKSAYEILNEKYAVKESENEEQEEEEKTTRKSTREEKSTFEEAINSPIAKQVGRTLVKEIMRGILGVLGVSATQRKRRR